MRLKSYLTMKRCTLSQGDDNFQVDKTLRYSGPDLPEDIWHHIHSLMPLRDAARAACVSRAFLCNWRCHPNLIFTEETLSLEQDARRKGGKARAFASKVDHILKNHSGIGVKRLKLVICYSGKINGINTPTVAAKFLHLKHLDICLDADKALPPEYDYLSLVSFLDASPVLETFILCVQQHDMKHECVSEDASHTRQMPEHKHSNLKNVMILGFCTAKSMVELTCHVLENATSLKSITLDTERLAVVAGAQINGVDAAAAAAAAAAASLAPCRRLPLRRRCTTSGDTRGHVQPPPPPGGAGAGNTCGQLIDARLTDEYEPPTPAPCRGGVRYGSRASAGGGWFRLWENLTALQEDPALSPCYADQLRLVYDPVAGDYRNVPGVDTRVVSFGSTRGFRSDDPA
uniref:Uncharacterized protein n=1 Tax=Oryza glumipatula TaxID=40148 RepID=A0A0D9YJZ2_9ORYZ